MQLERDQTFQTTVSGALFEINKYSTTRGHAWEKLSTLNDQMECEKGEKGNARRAQREGRCEKGNARRSAREGHGEKGEKGNAKRALREGPCDKGIARRALRMGLCEKGEKEAAAEATAVATKQPADPEAGLVGGSVRNV